MAQKQSGTVRCRILISPRQPRNQESIARDQPEASAVCIAEQHHTKLPTYQLRSAMCKTSIQPFKDNRDSAKRADVFGKGMTLVNDERRGDIDDI